MQQSAEQREGPEQDRAGTEGATSEAEGKAGVESAHALSSHELNQVAGAGSGMQIFVSLGAPEPLEPDQTEP